LEGAIREASRSLVPFGFSCDIADGRGIYDGWRIFRLECCRSGEERAHGHSLLCRLRGAVRQQRRRPAARQGQQPIRQLQGHHGDDQGTRNGPFPGDEALFKFNAFSAGDLKKSAGTAVFTCQYNFNKNAFCDAAYELTDGTLIGSGEFDFNASSFSLAIIGGTGKYRGRIGSLDASPGPKHSQRLVVVLN
jgi:hypothetical protein